MVSRRKILSRSRGDLNLETTFHPPEEEDAWHQKEKLFKDHIQEVLNKWNQIDDEIWAKVIVLERNRRVAKAYARAPVLTINGSDDGFDGFRIGLCGFDNPMRDPRTEELRRYVGHGVKIKMDDAGNILIKRISKCNVYIKTSDEETAVSSDILKLPDCALEPEKPFKLFDMKKFQTNMNRELKRAYPDRRRLEYQCLSLISFVKTEANILDCPIWVLIINVVAMDMLKSKLPPVQRPLDIKNRPRIPIPDEDPYAISNFHKDKDYKDYKASSQERFKLQNQSHFHAQRGPPKLPPRENMYMQGIPKPDYDDIEDERSMLAQTKQFLRGMNDRSSKGIGGKYDDPYYCGLRARVPNFVKDKTKENDKQEKLPSKRHSIAPQFYPAPSVPHLNQLPSHNGVYPLPKNRLWHSRSYDTDLNDFGVHHQPIYVRSRQPKRSFIGEWNY